MDEHVVIAGRNPFDGCAVCDADLRRAVELQAKSHLIHLREGYLEEDGRPDGVARLIASSIPAFRALVRNLSRLAPGAVDEGAERLLAELSSVNTIADPTEIHFRRTAHDRLRAELGDAAFEAAANEVTVLTLDLRAEGPLRIALDLVEDRTGETIRSFRPDGRTGDHVRLTWRLDPGDYEVVLWEPERVTALVWDTSGSMDGLINTARQTIWGVVNDLALAKPSPRLRLALISYGNNGHDPKAGWVKVESPLTDDLDRISQLLFSLTTNGGEEYVARAIHGDLGRE